MHLLAAPCYTQSATLMIYRLAAPQVRGDKTSQTLLLQRALFQHDTVVAVVTLQHFDICNLLTGQNDDML